MIFKAKRSVERAKPVLSVRIMSPTQTFYDGSAMSVSAVNETGPFDILEDHANFFSLLSEGNVVINTGLRSLTFNVNQGIMKVHNNHIDLFVDIDSVLTKKIKEAKG